MADPLGFFFNGKGMQLNLPDGGALDLNSKVLQTGNFKITPVTVTTTDNTVTTVLTVSCPASRTVAAWVFGAANAADTSDDGLVAFVYNAVKNAAGTTAVVGTSGGSNVESGAGSPAVTVVADDSADTLLVRVLGENSKTYNWNLLIVTCEIA